MRYVDLTLRGEGTLADAVARARLTWEERKAAGVDQVALDEAARQGLALGAFEESEEDGMAVVEEFYPAHDPSQEGPDAVSQEPPGILRGKLAHKLNKVQGPALQPQEHLG